MDEKQMIGLVNTVGDAGGYKLMEWFKLFPDDRERALREYIYLKVYVLRMALHQTGTNLTDDEFNLFCAHTADEYLASPGDYYGATPQGLLEALLAYQGQHYQDLIRIFAERSGIASHSYARQFVGELPDLFTTVLTRLRIALKS